ncbi:MAG: IS21 family transposase [Deltaproteobacteria bacterium]|jgi:transposase
MIRMDQYEYIRTSYRVYQKSIKQICRETGHSRETVRKVLRSEPFGYAPRVVQPYPVLGPYLQVIDQWLQEDKVRPRKQRHTAKRIYDRLVRELGFQGSDSTVRHYVRKARMRLGVQVTPAFIPLEPECGQEGEVDWGAAIAIIAGEKMPVKFFCMRSKYSGKHFVRCYPCERQQAFLDGHIHAFAFFEGIFRILIYDNLTTAVQKVLRGKGRVEQEEFIKFHAYHNFTPRFCNPASAHEKGGVEGLVGYVRRNYLVPIPVAESLEDLNDRLLEECLAYGDHRIKGREGTVNDLFAAECDQLLPLPQTPFTVIQITTGKVDAYATVIVDKNRYSVPALYSGLKVQIHLAVTWLEIFYNGKKLATHSRLFGNNKWQLNPDHYLELIQQRPMAFQSARPLRHWRKTWPPCLEKLLARFQESQGETAGIKDFISVLMLYRDHSGEAIQAAVELAVAHNLSSSPGVKHLLHQSAPGHAPLPQWPATQIPDVSVYGQLGGVS